MAIHLTLGASYWADTTDNGLGMIQGVTTFDGVPGPARVYVQDPRSLRVVRSMRSGPDGAYSLANLIPGVEYLVTAVDERRQDNAVVFDRVIAGVP